MKQLKSCIYIVVLGALVPMYGGAQVLAPEDDGIVKRSNMHHNKSNIEDPFEYSYLHEDDILWSERHWERIQVKEKINLPLFYPEVPQPDRMSLWDVLITALGIDKDSEKDSENKEVTIQYAYVSDDFTQIYSDEVLQGRIQTYNVDYAPNNIDTLDIDTISVNATHVVSYLIKSDWYFDKKRGELKNRIIAIAPEVMDPQTKMVYPAFWLWFPEARKALSTSVAFNEKNYKQRLTFDQIMHLRKFNSTIYKVDNVYNREIKDYYQNNAMGQLLEAARLKEDLRNKEHDMWTY
ncbi:MAG: gliding motility protein GldN [Flavobacteriales bacterium]|jgi:gliding motility associated protien GldN